jgi:membrane-associated phospholipid phosphatase
MATGNHFWLDVLAGIVLAVLTLLITYRRAVKSFIARLL